MYRCTECGSEYEVKPDFCDCGNDEFINVSDDTEVIKPDIQSVKVEQPKQEEKPKPQPAKQAAPQTAETVYTKQNIPPKKFSEQYPMLSDFFKSLDPISTGIFFICLILTCVVILYKPQITENPVKQKETVKTTKDIPHIDKFWNNELPKVEKKVETQEPPKTVIPEVQKIVQNITHPAVQQKSVPKTTTQKTSVQKVKQTTQKNQKAATNKTTSQTKQKTSTTQTVKPAATTQKAQTTQQTIQQTSKQQQQVTQVQQPQQTQQVQTPKTVQSVSAEETAKKTAQAKQELANYKAGLRNTIGRKIDFTKVVGDGNCIVSFKVNSSGKLTNRAFTQQSSNITLNDAVYAAVMATPTYNPPPNAYNNETMSLTIKFYNGNFEISIK